MTGLGYPRTLSLVLSIWALNLWVIGDTEKEMSLKIRKYPDYRNEFNRIKAVVKKKSHFCRSTLVISHAVHCTVQMQSRLFFAASLFKVWLMYILISWVEGSDVQLVIKQYSFCLYSAFPVPSTNWKSFLLLIKWSFCASLKFPALLFNYLLIKMPI